MYKGLGPTSEFSFKTSDDYTALDQSANPTGLVRRATKAVRNRSYTDRELRKHTDKVWIACEMIVVEERKREWGIWSLLSPQTTL